jgi:hypothetical protein
MHSSENAGLLAGLHLIGMTHRRLLGFGYRRLFANMLIREGWRCCLWRIDLWCTVAPSGLLGGEEMGARGCGVTDVIVKDEIWSENGVI